MDYRRLKERVGDYFNFSVNERWAVLVLVVLIFALFIAPNYFKDPDTILIIEDSLLRKATATIDSVSAPQKRVWKFKAKTYPTTVPEQDLFFFDPNTVSLTDLVRLGVKEKTAQTIEKYRKKGGRFKTAADLERIYGLPPELVKLLKPFVRIKILDTVHLASQRYRPATGNYPNTYGNFQNASSNYLKRKTPTKIKINLADSTEWESLPGIGFKLASRIIYYRKQLGGFYTIDQVAEVYGLQDSVFKRIEPFLENDGQPVKMILLNSVSREDLAAHPYFRKGIANAIEQYRTAHGRFEELADLKKIHLINEELFEKISRYCKID